MAGSPTLATIRRPRAESNATPFGLMPTPILKAFRSPPGVNTETVFSPRLVVNTKPRALDTSAPATAVNPGIDSTYRSRAQSITSIESWRYAQHRYDPWVNECRRGRNRRWIDAREVQCGRANEVSLLRLSQTENDSGLR